MNSQPPGEDYQLLTSWLAVIGMLTMFWSPVERHIDQCVHFLYPKQATQKRAKKPTRLKDKLDFIKINMPTHIIDGNQLDRLTTLTRSIVQIRDVCVHGVLNSYDHQRIEIGKINGRMENHVVENFTIDRNRLDYSANALSLLNKQWNSIALALLKYTTNI